MRTTFKIILFNLLTLSILLSSCAANPDHTQSIPCRLYEGYKHGKMDEWVKVMDELEKQFKQNKKTETLLLLTQTQYGYIGYLIGANKSSDAKQYISRAEKNVEILLNQQPTLADVIAIKASLMAYNIALNPFKAPFIGPRSMALVNDALTNNPQSFQANIEKGNSLHYAPTMFGGNPKEAVKYYKKAIEIFEKNGTPSATCSWQHLNALTQLALAYEKSNSNALADATYRQILLVAPDFKWVKEELYPKFRKKMVK